MNCRRVAEKEKRKDAEVVLKGYLLSNVVGGK